MLPQTMNAAVVHEFGKVLTIKDESVPHSRPDETISGNIAAQGRGARIQKQDR